MSKAAADRKVFEDSLLSRLSPGILRSSLRGLVAALAFAGAPTQPSHRLIRALIALWFVLIRRPTGWARVLPDVILIGASRSGTSSLARYLSEHPSFHPPFYKEVHYFNTRPHKSLLLYRSFFPTRLEKWFATRVRGRRFLTGDFTPSYYFCPHAPRHTRERLGEVKILFLLRDPIDRAFSQYCTAAKFGGETLSFEDAIEREPAELAGEMERMVREEFSYSLAYHKRAYIARGLYAEYLDTWLRHHKRENIMVIQSEEFAREPRRVFAEVCGFLGIEPVELDAYPMYNKWTEEGARVSPETRARLAAYFQPHNERLYAMLGKRFDWTAVSSEART